MCDRYRGRFQPSSRSHRRSFVSLQSSWKQVEEIADFQLGQDKLGLSGGLRFEQLAIAQGTGTSAQDTFVRIAANEELLAVLSNVPASSITNSTFTLV